MKASLKGSACLQRQTARCTPFKSFKVQRSSPCHLASLKTDSTTDRPTTDVDFPLILASAVAPYIFDVQSAIAQDGEFGILEGRTVALVHPAMMFTLLATSTYAAYLGYQWKRTREMGDEIRELRKQVPAAAADGSIPASPVTGQIEKLEKDRKDLVSGNYKDKHHQIGSILLGAGVLISIEGCVDTYLRTGKLFPGPHLFVGAIMTCVWAVAAALVPAMQKGNNTARQAHVALNVLNIGMFVSQVPTGLEIVGKVFQFTQWP